MGEVEKLSVQAVATIRRYKKAEILAFFKKCEKVFAEKPSEDAPSGEKEEAPKGKVAKVEEQWPSDEDLSRVFTAWDENETGSLTQEFFTLLIRVYMKVVNGTTITEELAVEKTAGKDTKPALRRLEPGEVLAIEEGPTKDPVSDLNRVRVRTMQDNIEGWVTVQGNMGTVFLKEGGGAFKVVKETIMTEPFDVGAVKDKDASKKVRDTTRKLKPGEIVDVREWPKKDDAGITRMQCRARIDGYLGWATTVGN